MTGYNLPEGTEDYHTEPADTADKHRECEVDGCTFEGDVVVYYEPVSSRVWIERWTCPNGHDHEEEQSPDEPEHTDMVQDYDL